VWKRLQHPNIVPFLGVPTNIPPFEIVCEWMENHRITEYVRKNPGADRVDLVSGFAPTITRRVRTFERQISQLWDVADGLHYLHSCNVIHGDLKGVSHLIFHFSFSWSQILIPTNSKANILIDRDGHARLTDFGLTSIIRGENSVVSPQDSNIANTTTWAAPEILEGGPVSKEGDVFTFAMVAVEVCQSSNRSSIPPPYAPSNRRSRVTLRSLSTPTPRHLRS
jgi:serine/threonine protein kinase